MQRDEDLRGEGGQGFIVCLRHAHPEAATTVGSRIPLGPGVLLPPAPRLLFMLGIGGCRWRSHPSERTKGLGVTAMLVASNPPLML